MRPLRKLLLEPVVSMLVPVCQQLRLLENVLQHELDADGIEAHADDIYIACYPRSGGTLVQMIVHQLRCGADAELDHIDRAVPFFGLGLAKPSVSRASLRPRFFKTHMHIAQLPKAAKCIYVVRRVEDVATSYFQHMQGLRDEWGRPFCPTNFDAFLQAFLAGDVPFGSWFSHVAGALSYRQSPRVLFLTYDILTAKLEACIRRIASFSGLPVPDDDMERILHRCSRRHWQDSIQQFHPMLGGRSERSFIRRGEVGDARRRLTTTQAAMFDAELGRIKQRFDRLVSPRECCPSAGNNDRKRQGLSRRSLSRGL